MPAIVITALPNCLRPNHHSDALLHGLPHKATPKGRSCAPMAGQFWTPIDIGRAFMARELVSFTGLHEMQRNLSMIQFQRHSID